MQSYRLYLIWDGHIRSAKQIEAEDDEGAILQAEELRGPEPAELWHRARIVRKFDHGPEVRGAAAPQPEDVRRHREPNCDQGSPD